ncbi:MAG: Lin0512 family protein [Pseudomonadota bacterium]
MTPLVAEFGLGTSLRRGDYTGAAERAVRQALWRNSINVAELMGFAKADMIIEVTIAVQQPEAVDLDTVRTAFPYGEPRVKAVFGGLDVPRADGTVTVMAQAALIVGFEMERTCSA